MTQRPPSRLLGLPPELRNRIYISVFVGNVVHIGRQRQIFISRKDYESAAPAILLACYQTYHEAYGIYYSTSRFVIFSSSVLHHWAESLPKSAQLALANVAYDCYNFRGMVLGPEATRFLAEYAEEVLHQAFYKQLRSPSLQHLRGNIEASIILATGKLVWTLTPLATYKESVKGLS